MKPNLIVWLMGGAGVTLLYSAVKNVNPGSLITSYFTGKKVEPLVPMGQIQKDIQNGGGAGGAEAGGVEGSIKPQSQQSFVSPNGKIQNYPSGYQSPSNWQNA